MKKANNASQPVIVMLCEFVKEVKNHLHTLNRLFFPKPKTQLLQQQLVELWGLIHSFRQEFAMEDPYEAPINKLAHQAWDMRLKIKAKESTSQQIEREFMILRMFAEQLEKSVVRYWYELDTGQRSTRIGGIKWAARRSKRSEITVRRYIQGNKIKAYQIVKIWWVPFEEIQHLQKKKGSSNDTRE